MAINLIPVAPLDGERAWPEQDSSHPPSLIRTIDPGRPVRLLFGSCRSPGTVLVHDPTGSGVTLFNVNLGINGLGDGLSDTINIVDDDPVTVTNNGGGDITITGLSGATVHITGFEAANDHLVINGDIFAI
jgi:hypothetical protein